MPEAPSSWTRFGDCAHDAALGAGLVPRGVQCSRVQGVCELGHGEVLWGCKGAGVGEGVQCIKEAQSGLREPGAEVAEICSTSV